MRERSINSLRLCVENVFLSRCVLKGGINRNCSHFKESRWEGVNPHNDPFKREIITCKFFHCSYKYRMGMTPNDDS